MSANDISDGEEFINECLDPEFVSKAMLKDLDKDTMEFVNQCLKRPIEAGPSGTKKKMKGVSQLLYFFPYPD